MDEFLLVVAWDNEPDLVRLLPCEDELHAVGQLAAMAPCSPRDLQVVAFVEMEGASTFKNKWTAHCSGWYKLSIAMKQCLIDEATNMRSRLPAMIAPSLAGRLRWPALVLSHAERRQLNADAGKLPRFVQSADDYVLWAVAEINSRRAFCCSRDIVYHPANKELYSKSTIYNILACFRKNGIVKEDIVATSKVFDLTDEGKQWLADIEAGYNAAHPRKSVKSMYGGLL